jgi:putative flippase GtrA
MIEKLGLLYEHKVRPNIREFFKYGLIGALSTVLNLAIFNSLILITGHEQGAYLVLFTVITYVVVITHSFFWNKYWVFKKQNTEEGRREYIRFFSITGVMALINIGVVHLLANIVGPQFGLSQHAWDNVALLVNIPINVVGNYFGYKFLVFKARRDPVL